MAYGCEGGVKVVRVAITFNIFGTTMTTTILPRAFVVKISLGSNVKHKLPCKNYDTVESYAKMFYLGDRPGYYAFKPNFNISSNKNFHHVILAKEMSPFQALFQNPLA